jgi:hypothetical protein
MRWIDGRWLTRCGLGLAVLVLAACGQAPPTGGAQLADFAGTWRGEALEYDLCTYDCPTVSGPYSVVIRITQDEGELIVDFDDTCTYEAQAVGSVFVGEEVDRGNGNFRCADFGSTPLPIAAELVDGVLSGRAYYETAGATYCMLEYGCYWEFEVTRDE